MNQSISYVDFNEIPTRSQTLKAVRKSHDHSAHARQRSHRRSHSSARSKYYGHNSVRAGAVEREAVDRFRIGAGEDPRRRRNLILERDSNGFGFTLQSYGIHYKKEKETKIITYVDYVAFGGSAFKAGMKEGDVILSVNENPTDHVDHQTLVNLVQNSGPRLRMVVVFENCVRKVNLHMRYIELQKLLCDKMSELEQLCHQEKHLLSAWRSQDYVLKSSATPFNMQHCKSSPEHFLGYSTRPSTTHKGSPYHGSSNASYTNYMYSQNTSENDFMNVDDNDIDIAPYEQKMKLLPNRKNLKNSHVEYQWKHQKPRSWDNLLSTKSFGGYGYGHGYTQVTKTLPSQTPAISNKLRSVSSYQIENYTKKDEIKNKESRDISAQLKHQNCYLSDESLASPYSSSCFSCDCLTVDSNQTESFTFSKSKSSENILQHQNLHLTPSNTCLVIKENRSPRSRTSIVDCLKGSNSFEEITQL